MNLFIGSVHINPEEVCQILFGQSSETVDRFIVMESRLPMAVTALLSGGALAVSGLMLQTAFRNPLAGPSILGISSGASLGVAVVMLFLGGTFTAGNFSMGGYGAIIFGAFTGTLIVMGLLLALSSIIKNPLTLLITGIMIGYLVSSVIMLLNFSATAEGVQNYVMWGMSSFSNVSMTRLPLFSILTLGGLILSFSLIKPLNLLLLGDNYALNLGLNLQRVRNLLLLSTGVLTAVTTAYCGPVSFIGLAVPHIARMIFRSDNHGVLMPATFLCGGCVGLICCQICVMPANYVLPLNAVTPLIGAPIVIWVLFRRRT